MMLLLAFLATAFAYKLQFYGTDDCSGPVIKHMDISVKDGYLQASAYNDVSASVSVADEPSDVLSTDIVTFFAAPDYDSSVVLAEGNTGCLNVGAAITFFSSIEVIRRDLPHDQPKRSDIKHGDFFEHDGTTWRWKQVAHGAFRNVRAEEWDSSVLADDTILEHGENYPFDFEA
ncbi:hypothetical protein Slin15195_G001860 [Septoria linicola]|uniref:Uncharacterized protein n=1 Tax=Septoria linicola TaxID=215465 RepID=A0A9Q9ADF1_9PEZI|nr:hypothetical protein Slin14017_G001890 [Septoria linicola]USW46867.1 hypothetical protein Slin15195_G001860 [Septoria linicola]